MKIDCQQNETNSNGGSLLIITKGGTVGLKSTWALATFGQKHCQTPEEFKAWSQNLGHEDVLTTLYSYGEIQQHRQGEIFQQLKIPRSSDNQNVDDIARAVVKAMADQYLQNGA